jgi:hypothetical protein
VGAYSSAGPGSTRAAYAADGYLMYYQGALSNCPIRVPFYQDVVHIEITFSQVVFRYVQ